VLSTSGLPEVEGYRRPRFAQQAPPAGLARCLLGAGLFTWCFYL